MQDTAVREALVAYAAAQPPMPYTAQSMLTAGKRSRRRRLGLGISGALMAAAVAAGVVLAPPDLLRANEPTWGPAGDLGPAWATLDPQPFCEAAAANFDPRTDIPASFANGKNGYGMPIPTEPADHAAGRLSCYLLTEVPTHLPGAVLHRDPFAPAGTLPFEAVAARVFDPANPGDTSPPYIGSSAVVVDDEGVGTVGFGASAAYQSPEAQLAECAGPDPSCEVRSGPNGELVTVLTVRSDNGYELVNVWMHKGQTMAFASASNGAPSQTTTPGSGNVVARVSEDGNVSVQRPGREKQPITVDELIAIIAGPEFTLFP